MFRGRGSAENPPNRFEAIAYETDPDAPDDERPAPNTLFFKDASRTIINTNDSPDVPFEASLNPYRGCENGCSYCFARPTHEYLGMSAGLDFETKILVKEDAPELLRKELASKRWEPKVIAISGVTDPYQAAEARFQVTRRCLEVLAEFRNPVAIVTKRHLVARDADILGELAEFRASAVFVSITSLDPELARTLEPRASAPYLRLRAIEELTGAGVPCGVMVAPLIPGLNDHEMPCILEAAAKAGAKMAGMVPLRLPYGVTGLFEAWLERHRPGSKEKVLNQVRSIREGRLNDPRFGSRMAGEGKLADHFRSLFHVACRRAGIGMRDFELSTEAFRRPRASGPQLELFA